MRYFLVEITLSLILLVANTCSTTVQHEKRTITEAPAIYDCGRRVFLEYFLQEQVRLGKWRRPQEIRYFQILLYGKYLNYDIVEIPPHLNQSPRNYIKQEFYIVLDQKDQIIDVIAELQNGHHMKCKRVDNSAPEPPDAGSLESYNYECGHVKFTDETLKFSAAQAAISKASIFPAVYEGNLFDASLGYRIHPITNGNKIHQLYKYPDTSYCIVIDPTNEVVDVIAKLVNGGYIKCKKTPRPSNNKSSVDLNTGFLCGTYFFDITYLNLVSEIAVIRKTLENPNEYPRIYDYSPFNERHWIYPVFPYGRFFGKGYHHLKHFLLMDDSFRVIFVGIKNPQGKLQSCEVSLRGVDISPPEKDDFNCYGIIFGQNQIKESVNSACKVLGTRHRHYPAKYVGPHFDIPGPYFTYPIMETKKPFRRHPGNFRVVLNSECQLAGLVLIFHEVFRKCSRVKDGTVPGGVSEIPIREIHMRFEKVKNSRKV